ncbi:uncharacterized protein LOC129577772 [Sitodiplosis mosellana]|uniref:uncharacterized protein LOC129577772 n=1 Tax=Sitodiplosis mosellana TaxID=263140 RepID=UPI0024446A43|nr:uncharacterized protein LOC129577772 [Sitodiplosis mosellana]
MSEEHSIENEDYDREDLEHVENLLYANIHYNTGCDESPNQSKADDNNASGSNSGYNTPTEADRSGPRRNAKRYWSTNTNTHHSGPSKFVAFFKEKQSGVYRPGKVTATDLNKSAPDNAKSDESRETNTATVAAAPKQFTPYVSFLPFKDSTSNAIEEPTATTSHKDYSNSNVQKTNNEMVRKSLATKHINPFSKKHTIDQYKQLLKEDEAIEAEMGKQLENTKRLNPFNPLSRKAKKRKSEANQNKNMKNNRVELKPEPVNTGIIDVDGEDKDDDDVIILPTQEPPLINLDSSDEEETAPTNAQEHEFTEPTAVSDNRRKTARCASPSSSIQSADDFIGQNDQRNFGFETFGTLSDEEMCQVSETVETQLRNKTAKVGSSKRAAIPSDNDNAIFTPPKQMQKDKTKATVKKSYEVGANSFTAVDVYESESSDMPDSVYAKGASGKRKQMSDSDSSGVEDVSIAKSKRLRKRKSSGSARESDHKHSDDSSSDLPEDDDDDTDDDNDASNENSYLVRGEALGKVKNSNKKKLAKANKAAAEKRSEDDFINKLSYIVHGQNESENDEPESPHETSTESVEARDIVETVLQRRNKKSKKNQNVEAEPNPSDTEKTNAWEVTDQVGETDELNLGRIFDENALESLNDDGKSLIEDTKSENTAIQEKQPETNKEQPQPTEEPSKSVEEPKQSTADETEMKTVPNEADDDDGLFGSEIGWNDEMRRFYNESWGGETFSVRNIRARMPKGFLNWMITNKDKFPAINTTRGRQFRCLNCQEKGHLAKNCPRPPSKKRCYMCGVEGHLEPKCPHKICLLCGRKSQRYSHGCGECNRDREIVCHLCRQKGHKAFLCPDKWRRYHSTTSLNEKPARKEKSPNGPPKVKYCCLCAGRGHYAENCSRANRTPGPLSLNITSYRWLLKSPFNIDNKGPRYTILASDLNDYNFNFGNSVSSVGNTIYGRFRRAVNLNANQSTTSENDVVFVNETNLHDTSDPPIEVYDDYDFEMDDLDDVSSSEQYSENTHDSSFMTIDNLNTEEHDTKEPRADPVETGIFAADKEAAIKRLDDKIHTLEELKEKMLSQKSDDDLNETGQSTDHDTTIESDVNVSGQKDDVTTSSALPDFIPLSPDEPEKYEPARSPSPVSADSTTNANEKSDATIHLTKDHCKKLLSEKGNQFLRDSELQYNVSVRLEWRQYGNVLIVNGIASNQQDFHNILREFFESNENPQKQQLGGNLPKNRDALIRYVRSQVAVLDSPMCNVKHMADVQGLFNRIRQNEQNPSKSNVKQNLRLRKHLNMVLFGRYGFAEGKSHLDELQKCLRGVISGSSQNVPVDVRQKMGEHMAYVFSGDDHKNYENIIEHYNQMRKDRTLPPLILDRKLFGLKINVYPSDADTDNNTSKRKKPLNYVKYNDLPTPSNSRLTSTMRSAKVQNSQLNTPPSLLDIQINVSTPSTSNAYQNESMQRRHSFSSNRNHVMDKWKY